MNHYKIKISGREFFPQYVTTRKEKINRQIKSIVEFSIDLDMNPEFKNVDFKDDLEVFGISNNLLFRGCVKSYVFSEKCGYVIAQDYSLKLEIDRLSEAEAISMKPNDMLGLITESSGIIPNFPVGSYNTNERDFIIIIPIQNLNINQNFYIGNVEFYCKFDNIDDDNIKKSNNGRNESLWRDNSPRAKTVVRAKQFYEAIIRGYNNISKVIDVIALRTDLSFPSIKINDALNRFEFDFYTYYSRVKIPTFVYCREINTNAHVIFGIVSIKENTLVLEKDTQIFFKEVNDLFNDLIVKNELDEEENNILQVLHWLRRAIQEGADLDKFIDLWIAFEFLISGVKTKKLFTKDDRSIIYDLISNTEFSDEQKDVIISKMDMLNDSPMMAKFDFLIDSLNIDLSKDERELLDEARSNRLDLFHGKRDIVVNDEKLNKMRSIIEKILIAKINVLKFR